MTLRSWRTAGWLAALGVLSIVAAAKSGARDSGQPRLIPVRGAGPVSAAEAQRRADFVIYLPSYLPQGAGEPKLLFAPEQELPHVYVPKRIYATYRGEISLWQMPTLGRPLRHPAVPVPLGGRMGWASQGPGKVKTTLEWLQGDTQLGLTAPLPLEDLFKIAGSAVEAAPEVPMAAPSAAQQRNWAPAVSSGPPPGGVGIMLSPGAPPMVLSLEPGSPAARAGIRPGDIVTAVNGRDVTRLRVAEVANLVRGEPGTQVTLTLQRKGSVASVEVLLRRGALPAMEAQEVTPAEARALLPFKFMEPRWLPRGYRLVGSAVVRRSGKPFEARLIYHGAGTPLLVVSETDARAGIVGVTAGKGIQQVAINGATGYLSTGGGMSLSWVKGGTAVLLQSRGLGREAALKIARSMR